MNQRHSQATPLPPFVVKFLAKKRVRLTKSPKKLAEPEENTTLLGQTINQLLENRTHRAIFKAYESFKGLIYGSPIYLHFDFQQILFPLFIHLALQLLNQKLSKEFQKFIQKYRKDHPTQNQQMIDELLNNPDNYIVKDFTIELNEYAMHVLTLKLKQIGSYILSYVINTNLNIKIGPINHKYKYLYPKVTDFLKPETEDGIETKYKFLDSEFVNSKLSPPISDTLPETEINNIAHFTVRYHFDTISDIKMSKCARLFAISQESTLTLHCLDDEFVFPNSESSINIATHKSRIVTSAFSPNSCLLASSSLDSEMIISHTEAAKPIIHHSFHLLPVLNVCWDKSNFFVSAASQDTSISLWTVSDQLMVRHFCGGHSKAAIKSVFSNDNQYIISISTDRTICIWEIGSAKLVNKFSCGISRPVSLAVHPTEFVIACGFASGAVILIDGNTCQQVWVSSELESYITDLTFNEDGTILIASALDGLIGLWKINIDNYYFRQFSVPSSTCDGLCFTKYNLICSYGRSSINECDEE